MSVRLLAHGHFLSECLMLSDPSESEECFRTGFISLSYFLYKASPHTVTGDILA